MNRNITSNNLLFNRLERQPSRINMPKDAFMSPLWNKENNPNGSSNSSSTSPENVEHNTLEQLNRNINQLAREKRRQILLAQQNCTNDCSTSTDYENNDYTYNFYEQSTPPGADIIINHKMNCYTIINQHYNITDNEENHNDNNLKLIHYYDDEYNRSDGGSEDPDGFERKRLWARPFRNKLSSFEQILNAQDSESPYSDEFEEYIDSNDPNVRVPTPLPNDLSPPRFNRGDMITSLPTVAEISEVKSTHDIGCQNSVRSLNVPLKNAINGWFSTEDSEKSTMTEKLMKQDKETNYFSTEPFSPRQRRRFTLNQQNFRVELPPLKEKNSLIIDMKHAQSESPKDVITRKDIGDIPTVNTPRFADKSVNTQDVKFKSVEVSTDDLDTFQEQQVGSIIDLENRDDFYGELKMRTFDARIDPLKKPKGFSTAPLERLDTDSWIDVKEDSNAEHKLLARNMGLLKAAEWSAYKIITRSHVSLDISLAGTDYVDDIPWWTKLFNCILCRNRW